METLDLAKHTPARMVLDALLKLHGMWEYGHSLDEIAIQIRSFTLGRTEIGLAPLLAAGLVVKREQWYCVDVDKAKAALKQGDGDYSLVVLKPHSRYRLSPLGA
jgi:hypothetical protein